MPTVYRVTALWSGFAGAPGYTRFSFGDLVDETSRNAAGLAIRTFFEALKFQLPGGTTIQVQPTIDGFDMQSGQLITSASMTTTPTVVTSTVTPTAYAAGSGFVVTWNTSVVFNGHRVRGRSFIVPCHSATFATDGSLDSTVVTAATTAGNTLCSSSATFSVWSRQYSADTPPVQIGGALAPADSCTVKDAASQLRSRRT